MIPTRPSPAPFDAARALLADLPEPDAVAQACVQAYLQEFTRTGPLGELAVRLSGWTKGRPIARPLFALYAASYAGDDGAPARIRAHLEALAGGGGLLSPLARPLGAGVEVFDLALDRPVTHPRDGVPLREREAAATLAFGMEALAKAPDLLVLSDLAEGSSAVAADLVAALEAGEGDALDRLATRAGREVAALAGAILAARVQRTPVVLGSAAALAAAAVLARGRKGVLDHCFAASASLLQARLSLPAVTVFADGEGPGVEDPGVAGAVALALLKLASELAAAALPSGGRAPTMTVN